MGDPLWWPNVLLVELWPSPSEIAVYAQDDYYIAGLRSFYDSHRELEKNLLKAGVRLQWYTHLFRDKGKEVMRSAPPTVVDFIVWLGTSGLAVALYKVLDLWVRKVNGRRFKVKFDGIEVEATQLTEEQFEKLLQRIMDHKKQSLEHSKEINEVQSAFSDYPITDPDVRVQEKLQLWQLYYSTQKEFSKKTKEPTSSDGT